MKKIEFKDKIHACIVLLKQDPLQAFSELESLRNKAEKHFPPLSHERGIVYLLCGQFLKEGIGCKKDLHSAKKYLDKSIQCHKFKYMCIAAFHLGHIRYLQNNFNESFRFFHQSLDFLKSLPGAHNYKYKIHYYLARIYQSRLDTVEDHQETIQNAIKHFKLSVGKDSNLGSRLKNISYNAINKLEKRLQNSLQDHKVSTTNAISDKGLFVTKKRKPAEPQPTKSLGMEDLTSSMSKLYCKPSKKSKS